ncbi:MAG: SurA N-terminal domain-containing protein [Planctomycetes bacterium]|nr:SurA N-terminal domain-containing protein [Planctomycetota bacterium]
MFQWYHKNFKKYERLIFAIFLAIIVISFAASGVSQEMSTVIGGKDKAEKDLAVDTPVQKFTRMEYENLIFRWKHGLTEQGSMLLSFLMAHGGQIYQGDFRKNLIMYAYGQDTRELDRVIGVDICVLIGAAKQADMRVTDQEIAAKVKDTLSRDGGFDMDKYTKILSMMEMEAEDYEKTMGEFLLVDKYLKTLKSSVSVATEDVFNEYFKTGGRAKAKYVFFDDVKYRTQAKSRVSQKSQVDMLRIKKSSFGYSKQPQARLEYLRIPYEPLLAGIPAPTEDEMKAYYEGHKSDFPVPTCEMPPPEAFFVPQTTMVAQKRGEEEEKPADNEPEVRYTKYEDVKYRIGDKAKISKAEALAAETMEKITARLFEMRMQGIAKPDFKALAQEFKLEDPGSSAWFEEDDSKALDDSLGIPKAGSPGWYTFFSDKPETARPGKVRTDKASLLVRLIEKNDGNSFLFTQQVRSKAIADCATRDASLVARKEVESIMKDYHDRFDKAYAEKIKGGASPPEEELTALRFDTFTTISAERKLTVKETDYITRADQVADVADDRQFLQAMFEIEAKGDVHSAFGNSGQYLVQLVEKRAPKADDFRTKRTQIQKSLLSDKQGTFLAATLAQYKKENCKIAADLQEKELK